MATNKRRKMTKRKKIIFAFIVVIIAVLLFSVIGVGVIYLWGGQQTIQTYYPENSNTLNDITVIPSVANDSIEIEAVTIDEAESDTETATDTEEAAMPDDAWTAEETDGDGDAEELPLDDTQS